MRRTSLLAVALAIGLAASACSSTKHTGDTAPSASAGGSSSASGDTTTHKAGGTITISNEQGQVWPCKFNPFNPSVYAESNGFVYEPLVFVNLLKDQAETKMLASDYKWNADKTSITFTIRDGVKWSDGQAFTADDVAYTFNMMKGNDALDLYALWSGAGLQDVSASGNTLTLKFKQNAQVYFYSFANQVVIVPKHIFSAPDVAAKPDQWDDVQPVGTGPFIPKCSANNIEYTANPTYWQTGKPYIQKIEYPAYLDNAPANQDLAAGKAQWGSQFIPSIKSFFLDKSQDNHTWSPPVLNIAIYPNNDPSHKATSQLAVRQAISLAIDRNKVSSIGEDGQEPPANPTGVVLPTFQKYYDASAVQAAGMDKVDVAKATQLMASAGYTPANPLKLTIITITGYTDWDASLAVVKDELKAIGVDLTVSDLEQGTFNTKLQTGDYDLAYYGQPTGGPTPYYELRQILHSANTKPIGTAATGGNMERYKNPAVDKMFDDYASADQATQVSLLKQIGAAMAKDVPVIPVTESVDWFQYNTKDIAGWPTKDDPYAQPAAFNWPDLEQVLLHLYSKSAQ